MLDPNSEKQSLPKPARGFALSTGRALALIACFWGLTRLYPFRVVDPRISWETQEAHKLLDYGFLDRAGAILNPIYCSGRITNPAQFNHVDHPVPVFWLLALTYHFAGAWGPAILAAAVSFLSSWLLFLILKSHFDVRPALLATLAYTLAAPSIYYSFDPVSVYLSAVVWIAALFIINAARNGEQIISRRARLLGLCMFLAGQLDWYALSITPALLAITADRKPSLKETLRASWRNPSWRWTVAGSLLGLFAFLLQIFFYSPKLAGPLDRLLVRTGLAHTAITGSSMVKMLFIKIVVAIVGPALFLGFCLGAWTCYRRKEFPPLVLGAV